MYSYLGHVTAFVCELVIVAARGIEGVGLVAITALLSSAYLVSSGLVREWHAVADTYSTHESPAQRDADYAGPNGRRADKEFLRGD